MAVYFLPFRGRAVISCFNLSLSFFHPCGCLLILPQHLQQPTEKGWFHIFFNEGFAGRNMTLPTQKWRWASPAFHLERTTPLPSKCQLAFQTRTGNTSTASSAPVVFACEVCHEVFLIILTYFHPFRAHNVCGSDPTWIFPTCRSLQERCSPAPWWEPWQNGKSHVHNPFDAPLIFPCNSEAWGDDLLKWVIKTVSTFSLGSLAFEALRTRPGVPVSRCCSLKCVNQCRLAEVMSYIKRQMFNNELRKVVQRTWTQLHDGKKNGSSLPLPVSLDITNVLLKIYLCSAFSSSHPLIKHTAAHLNCSFCLLRFATVCYKAYSEGASWRGHDKSIFVKAGH